jgi:hypothetical protein
MKIMALPFCLVIFLAATITYAGETGALSNRNVNRQSNSVSTATHPADSTQPLTKDDSAIKAANIQANATIKAAWITFLAALIALVAAIFGVYIPERATRKRWETERREKAEREQEEYDKRGLLATFILIEEVYSNIRLFGEPNSFDRGMKFFTDAWQKNGDVMILAFLKSDDASPSDPSAQLGILVDAYSNANMYNSLLSKENVITENSLEYGKKAQKLFEKFYEWRKKITDNPVNPKA